MVAAFARGEPHTDGVQLAARPHRCYINEYTVRATIAQKATQATRAASSPRLKLADSDRPAGTKVADSGRPTGTAERDITSRSLRRARQNNAFETLATSLPPSRKIRRRCPGVEHLVVHSVTAAHGVPNRPCGGAVRHVPLLSHAGRAVTILPQACAETPRKVQRTPVSCPPVPQGPLVRLGIICGQTTAGLPRCERGRVPLVRVTDGVHLAAPTAQ